jgi:hypothetical protein
MPLLALLPAVTRDLAATAVLQPSPWSATLISSTWSVTIVGNDTQRRADSLEYVKVTLTADHDITADTVQLSVDGGTTWVTAASLGNNTYGVLAGPGGVITWPTAGQNYKVLARVTDSPEIPVLDAGRIYVG